MPTCLELTNVTKPSNGRNNVSRQHIFIVFVLNNQQHRLYGSEGTCDPFCRLQPAHSPLEPKLKLPQQSRLIAAVLDDLESFHLKASTEPGYPECTNHHRTNAGAQRDGSGGASGAPRPGPPVDRTNAVAQRNGNGGAAGAPRPGPLWTLI